MNAIAFTREVRAVLGEPRRMKMKIWNSMSPFEARASPAHLRWRSEYWAMKMKARITVTLKTGILDPQGKAIEGALKSLGVDGVASVRQGKVFDIELSGSDKAKAEAALKDAADKLLANTVIENYRVELL
jgi:phosphoribosylformylglycinamidine synthase subunit PurS